MTAQAPRIRQVDDDEVSFYREHGWVKLDGLVSQDLTAHLLETLQETMRVTESSWDTDQERWNIDQDSRWGTREFDEWTAARVPDGKGWFAVGRIRREPFFPSFTYDRGLGSVMYRMMNRERLTDAEVGVRFVDQSLPMVPPDEPTRRHRYHQDTDYASRLDRTGGATVWIALDEVGPDQAAMRFLSGSHREGPLGLSFDTVENTAVPEQYRGGVLEEYPKLLDLYELSPPFHYRPGDATVHHAYTIHGTPENRTDRPRWSYIASYVPADAVVVGEHVEGTIVYP